MNFADEPVGFAITAVTVSRAALQAEFVQLAMSRLPFAFSLTLHSMSSLIRMPVSTSPDVGYATAVAWAAPSVARTSRKWSPARLEGLPFAIVTLALHAGMLRACTSIP